MKLPAHGIKWQCGRCETWNQIEKGTCSKCGAIAQQFAACFQLKNALSVEEENFYKNTAQAILLELRQIKELLKQKEEIHEK
jgi:hypothetical protein